MSTIVLEPAALPQPSVTAPPYHYRAYGCSIASDFHLPELSAAPDPGSIGADLTIMAAALDQPMPSGLDERLVDIGDQCSRFSWSGFGRVSIVGNRTILVDLEPDFDRALLGFILLGPILAATLHGRGLSVLHGSAIAPARPDAGAFILLGDSGAGKSTFAAACLAAGCRLINDDVAAIGGIGQGRPLIAPGFPSLKLSRTALSLFDPVPGDVLPAGTLAPAKLRLRVPDDMLSQPRAIQRICILQRGETLRLDPLSPTAGLQALMRYSYLPKFGAQALAGRAAARHFAQCAAMADSLPISMLTVPSALADLKDAAWRLTTSAELAG